MKIWLGILFLILSVLADPKTGTISGIIVESGSQTPIIAAEVKVDGTQLGAFTDKAGYYLIANVLVGTHTLLVTREGYRSRNIANVEVKNALRTTQNITLDPQPSETYSLESRADYYAKPADTTASYDHLTAEEIRRSPGAAEDVNLVLQSLPGVAPDYDKSANLIVRGGMPWENLTLVDGFYTGPAVHFSSDMGSGGDVFSTINGKVLNGVDFYAGGFPARYGDRLSSVTAITLRNPATDRFHGEGDFNVVGFSSRLEGPITPWASLLLAGRYSFVEVLSSFMDLGIGGAIPKYYDWQGKSIIVPGQNQQIELLTLGTNDRIHLTPEDMGRPYGQDYKSRHAFYGSGYTVNWAVGITEVRLSSTDQTWDLLFDQDYTYTRSVGYDLKLDHQLPLSEQWLTRFGGEGGLTEFRSHYDYAANYTEDGQYIAPRSVNFAGDADQEAGYATLEYSPAPWKFIGGGRYDRLSMIHRDEISPRGGVSCEVVPGLTLKGTAGRFTQFPLQTVLIAYGEPPDVLAETAIHYVGGVEYVPAEAWLLSLEAYYKDLRRIITYDQSGNPWVMTNDGLGYTEGAELILRRQFVDNYYMLLSYGYMRSRENDGIGWFIRDYEQPHVFNVQGGFMPTRNWFLGAKWRYATGRPYTPIVGRTYNPAIDKYFAIEGARNSARYPYYSRVDLRVERKDYPGGLTLVTYLEIWNLLDRPNIADYYWNEDYSGYKREYSYTFTPVLGFSVEF